MKPVAELSYGLVGAYSLYVAKMGTMLQFVIFSGNLYSRAGLNLDSSKP